VSSWNTGILSDFFSFLPDPLRDLLVNVTSLFVGEGWHLTLGLLFMVIVIFLPGGLMEGFRRIGALLRRPKDGHTANSSVTQPAE
jgi:ABC-type branched-subunit amino acid transport system permease subunit